MALLLEKSGAYPSFEPTNQNLETSTDNSRCFGISSNELGLALSKGKEWMTLREEQALESIIILWNEVYSSYDAHGLRERVGLFWSSPARPSGTTIKKPIFSHLVAAQYGLIGFTLHSYFSARPQYKAWWLKVRKMLAAHWG